jgi:hypothetical protein
MELMTIDHFGNQPFREIPMTFCCFGRDGPTQATQSSPYFLMSNGATGNKGPLLSRVHAHRLLARPRRSNDPVERTGEWFLSGAIRSPVFDPERTAVARAWTSFLVSCCPLGPSVFRVQLNCVEQCDKLDSFTMRAERR